MEIQDPTSTVGEIEAQLSNIESQLTQLTREGSAGGRPLEEVIAELTLLSRRVRPDYSILLEMLERRDLTYELMTKLEEVRRRALWLYRRSRLEQIFYSKLKLERSLRDMLYRQILEGYDEFSDLEATESLLRTLPEDRLAAELLQEEGTASGE